MKKYVKYYIINIKGGDNLFEKLKTMYQDKLIEDVKEFDNHNYYYFYKDYHHVSLFGISKKISNNEYELLKELYIEKKIYSDDPSLQKIYEYICENKTYPFKEKKLKMVIFSLKESDEKIATKMLYDIYNNNYIIKLYDFYVYFLKDDIEIKELFMALSEDLGYEIHLHEGPIINKTYLGSDLSLYLKSLKESNLLTIHENSDLADLTLHFKQTPLINVLMERLFVPLFKDQQTRDIINVMLKNDLNVSKSAKLLYMNRNSLINKIETIYKETNLNLQKFTHACVIYMMLNLEI